jgi:hypothetical protein
VELKVINQGFQVVFGGKIMGLGLRNSKRYGLFKANSSEGEIKIDIHIYGFGEEIIVYKDKIEIAYVDTSSGEELDETDEYIYVDRVKVYKPFTRCFRRY